jgi:glycosyltransferase involved in cell wall biosynthesis
VKLLLSIEQRYQRTPDGHVWGADQLIYPALARYLDVFDEVIVLARVREVPRAPSGWLRADGPRVRFHALPYYVGPQQYARSFVQVRRSVARALEPGLAVIMHTSTSQIANVLHPLVMRQRRPYGVRVVGDPVDAFAPGTTSHPLRSFFRWWYAANLRRQCAYADAASFVTTTALQTRYPCPRFSVAHTDAVVSEATCVAAPRPLRPAGGKVHLVSIGSLARMYKAPDVLLHAMARAVAGGLDLELTYVGEGQHRPEMEALARSLGLADRVCFTGQLTERAAVVAALDHADLFVLASRTEGLPRAMLEAMARALPCIGSTVGGIPELLPAADLVPPGDAAALAAKIREVVTNPARMAAMSRANLDKTREYHDDAQRATHVAFCERVAERTRAFYGVA